MGNRSVGQRGEDRAVEFLVGRGFQIAERNWRCRWGEVDIVVWDGQTVYLVEVKARTSGIYGMPAEAVGQKKLARMKRVAQEYAKVRQVVKPIGLGVVTILGEEPPEWITEIEVVD
jgi:putative endonuclease